MRVDPSDAPTSTFFQPVIVHAILDAEVLQNSDRDLSRAAMDLVRSASFSPSGFQQEVFINVQFHLPAVELGGPPIFALFRALGDLGTATQSCAGESAIALREIRTD
jgi:hypothetical protein